MQEPIQWDLNLKWDIINCKLIKLVKALLCNTDARLSCLFWHFWEKKIKGWENEEFYNKFRERFQTKNVRIKFLIDIFGL